MINNGNQNQDLSRLDPTSLLGSTAAARLLLLRRKARITYADYLRYWIEATKQPFIWGWHWDYLADLMQAVALRQEDLRFLNINIPPRFAKSTLISQQWQAWLIGMADSPRSSVFSVSSSAQLAARDSKCTLDTVRSEWYRALFPHVTIGGKETEAEWSTVGGAYRIACGRAGTVTGRGAHAVILDDLISAEEGDSEVVREEANNFLGRSLRSRLDDQKTGTITNIQQRLHERDATGILEELSRCKGGDRYTTITLPNEATTRTVVTLNERVYATRNPGDLLHPQYLGGKETAALKAAMRGNYDGQYQQSPTKLAGGHLDPSRLVRLDQDALAIKTSLGIRPFAYMDFAATEKQTQKDDPDFTVISIVGKDQFGRLVILDIWRKQTADYSLVARTLINMHRLWQPFLVKGEKGAMLNQFQPVLNQQMRATGHYLTCLPTKARTSDKVERSMSFQGMLNAGMVAVPAKAPWLLDLEAELRGFPKGRKDDMCDTLSDAAMDYDSMRSGDAPTTHPTDPAIQADQEIKDRIEAARNRQLYPKTDDPYDWN